MASYDRRQWRGNPTGQTYRDRRPCSYDAYLPDPLAGRDFALSGDVAADVAAAEASTCAPRRTGRRTRRRPLIRATDPARRVGRVVSHRRIGGRGPAAAPCRRRAPSRQRYAGSHGRGGAGQFDAMSTGVEAVGPGDPIEPATVAGDAPDALAGTPLQEYGGRLRDQQNWIGGSGYNPCAAAFVPPPPEVVKDLFEDLCAFASADVWSPLIQAAVTHAQFETIHPFARRQRARGPRPDPPGLAAPRSGVARSTAHLAGVRDVAFGLCGRPARDVATSDSPIAPTRVMASTAGSRSLLRRACVRRAMPHALRSRCRRSRRNGSSASDPRDATRRCDCSSTRPPRRPC